MPSQDNAPDQDEYIGTPVMARMWGVHNNIARRIAADVGIRIRQFPGLAPRYHRGDVEALAARSYRIADESTKPVRRPHRRSAAV